MKELLSRLNIGILRLNPKDGKSTIDVLERNDTFQVNFSGSDNRNGKLIELNYYLFGDLKFLFMMMGRSGYEGSYCLYCHLKSKEWKRVHEEENKIHCGAEKWKVSDLVNAFLPRSDEVEVSVEPKGQKESPLWTFIPIENCIIPLLHILLGLGNNIIDHFWSKWFDERVETLTSEEITARHMALLAEIAFDDNEEKLNDEVQQVSQLKEIRDEIKDIISAGVGSEMTHEDIRNMEDYSNQLNEQILEKSALCEQMKQTMKDLQKSKRTAIEKEQSIRKKRGNMEKSMRVSIELDLLSKYNVTPSKYHGGKMEGPAVRNMLKHGKEIFDDITNFIYTNLGNEDSRDLRNYASNEEVQKTCENYGSLCVILDAVVSYIYSVDNTFDDDHIEELER